MFLSVANQELRLEYVSSTIASVMVGTPHCHRDQETVPSHHGDRRKKCSDHHRCQPPTFRVVALIMVLGWCGIATAGEKWLEWSSCHHGLLPQRTYQPQPYHDYVPSHGGFMP